MPSASARYIAVDIVGFVVPLSIFESVPYSISAFKANSLIPYPLASRSLRKFAPKALQYSGLVLCFCLAFTLPKWNNKFV